MADDLTERQKKWLASVQASLERVTGKTRLGRCGSPKADAGLAAHLIGSWEKC